MLFAPFGLVSVCNTKTRLLHKIAMQVILISLNTQYDQLHEINDKFNKPGTAQVGAISKAQKDENHFFRIFFFGIFLKFR